MKKLFVVALAVLCQPLVAQSGAKLDAWTELAYQFDEISSTKEELRATVDSSLFDLAADFSVNSDKKFGADVANFRDTKTLFDVYYLMEEGYAAVNLAPLRLQAGRAYQRDTYQSPYSLFLNSQGVSANGMNLRYEDPTFLFETRWIELNSRSDFGSAEKTSDAWRYADGADTTGTGTGYPDRGANLKTFVFKNGSHRFGIQDASVYTGRSFDLEYFVNPLPEYLIQYFKTTSGRPWTTSGNENNLLGFFWDWKEAAFSLGAQFLLDDFSLHFLLPDQVPDNPWKAAWTFGAEFESPIGRVGLHHAGALKYTFAPITTNKGSESVSAYGYTLYPSNQYWAGSGFRTLSIEDNAFGYLHGENNLALMVTWADSYGRDLDVSSNIELVLAGDNSSTNPWHDDTESNEAGTHWIDGDLQRTIAWSSSVRWRWQNWEFWANTRFGWIANVLELTDPEVTASNASSVDLYEKIWRPSDSSEPIVELAVGATWHWDNRRP